jgi:protein arginine N-methyltransferase 5
VPVAASLSPSDLESRFPRDTLFIDDARSRTYDAVCVPLTTANWLDRWRGMCIMSSEPKAEGSELRAETWRANPAFELGEVTMTRLGMSMGGAAMRSVADGSQMDQRKLKASL